MLADNLGELDVVLNDIGDGFVLLSDQLKKIDPATIEALKTALLSAYEALKNVASTLVESRYKLPVLSGVNATKVTEA